MSPADPYSRLADLAERERTLVAEGRFEELDALGAVRERLIATLPERPPATARPALERAAALQREVTAALTAARDEVAAELRRLDLGRTTMRGYGAGAPPATLVDRAG